MKVTVSSSVNNHIHTCLFFYVRPWVEPNAHSFSCVCVKSMQMCLAFFIRLSIVGKALPKIFLQAKNFAHKETHVSEEKEKKKKNCAITFKLHSIEYFVRLVLL